MRALVCLALLAVVMATGSASGSASGSAGAGSASGSAGAGSASGSAGAGSASGSAGAGSASGSAGAGSASGSAAGSASGSAAGSASGSASGGAGAGSASGSGSAATGSGSTEAAGSATESAAVSGSASGPLTIPEAIPTFTSLADAQAWALANDVAYFQPTKCVQCTGGKFTPKVSSAVTFFTNCYGCLTRQAKKHSARQEGSSSIGVLCEPTDGEQCAVNVVCNGLATAGSDECLAFGVEKCPKCPSDGSKKGLLGLLGLLGLIPLLLCCFLCLGWLCCCRRKKTDPEVHFATFDPYAGDVACGGTFQGVPAACGTVQNVPMCGTLQPTYGAPICDYGAQIVGEAPITHA